MSPILWLGGGGLIAYLLLRSKGAAAATTARALSLDGSGRTTSSPLPAPQDPTLAPSMLGGPAPQPATPNAPPSIRPPQIVTSVPPWPDEVAGKRPAPAVQLDGRWGWPVPRWQGRAPVISDGFGSPRPSTTHTHRGVDLMFARISSDRFPIGPNGSKAFVMPDAWMAVAASDGVLWSAGHTPRGFAVVIDHGTVATFYQHLETLLVPEAKPPTRSTARQQLIPIKVGQPLGVIGADPLDPGGHKHLHFELWLGGPMNAIDPQPLMKTWQVISPTDNVPRLQPHVRNVAIASRTSSRARSVCGCHDRYLPTRSALGRIT